MLSKRADSLKTVTYTGYFSKRKGPQSSGPGYRRIGAGEPDFDTPEHIKQAA